MADGLLSETGTRTFAVSEIMVRKPWRRRGIGRVLLVTPENTAAQAAYARWGGTRSASFTPAGRTHPCTTR
ncbi:MAG: hypothetical protein ACRDZ4_00720 [Egibacteraceae bacterium]